MIPVIVVFGFPGSGKSTLLNRLIRRWPRRWGLLVNEFGQVGLEGQLIQARTRPLIELSEGCLCCVNPSDLGSGLAALRFQDPRLEAVLIEASGLSDPGPVLAALAARPPAGFALSSVLAVFDGADGAQHRRTFPWLDRALGLADWLVVTKLDLTGAARGPLEGLDLPPGWPPSRVLRPDDLRLHHLLDGTEAAPARRTDPTEFPKEAGGPHHSGARAWTWEGPGQISLDGLKTFFETLPETIFRGKGQIALAHPSGRRYKYLFQYTGRQKHLDSLAWGPGEARLNSVVFSGMDYEPEALTQAWEACLVP